MKFRKVASQIQYILAFICTAFIIWRTASITTGTESSVMVVLSASMDPAINRGDLIFITRKNKKPVKVNDICVFELPGRSTPIVHRVVKVHQNLEDSFLNKAACITCETEYILTKGDSNLIDDRLLYDNGSMWIHKENIIGTVKGFVPYVGWITIWMNDLFSWTERVINAGIKMFFVHAQQLKFLNAVFH